MNNNGNSKKEKQLHDYLEKGAKSSPLEPKDAVKPKPATPSKQSKHQKPQKPE